MSRDARDLLRWLQVGLIVILLAGCSRRQAPQEPGKPVEMKTAAAPSPALAAKGAEIYEQNCATCHYGGEGSPVAPPLKGSTVVNASAKDVALVILKGQQGKAIVNGRPLNGMMPAQAYLTDEEIAAVVTFVRKEFGNGASGATPAEIPALR